MVQFYRQEHTFVVYFPFRLHFIVKCSRLLWVIMSILLYRHEANLNAFKFQHILLNSIFTFN